MVVNCLASSASRRRAASSNRRCPAVCGSSWQRSWSGRSAGRVRPRRGPLGRSAPGGFSYRALRIGVVPLAVPQMIRHHDAVHSAVFMARAFVPASMPQSNAWSSEQFGRPSEISGWPVSSRTPSIRFVVEFEPPGECWPDDLFDLVGAETMCAFGCDPAYVHWWPHGRRGRIECIEHAQGGRRHRNQRRAWPSGSPPAAQTPALAIGEPLPTAGNRSLRGGR